MRTENYICTNPSVEDGTLFCDGDCSTCGYLQTIPDFEDLEFKIKK